MTKAEILKKTWRGGGCEFTFVEAAGSRATVLLVKAPPMDEIPLKKMEAAHAAMGRAIEAWREREP